MNKLKRIFKKDKGGSAGTSQPTTTTSQTAPSSSTNPGTQIQSQAPASTGAATDAPKGVLFNTSLGDITIALYTDETPKVMSFPFPLHTPFYHFSTEQHKMPSSRNADKTNVMDTDMQEFRHPCLYG